MESIEHPLLMLKVWGPNPAPSENTASLPRCQEAHTAIGAPLTSDILEDRGLVNRKTIVWVYEFISKWMKKYPRAVLASSSGGLWILSRV